MREQKIIWYTPSEVLPDNESWIFINSFYQPGVYENGKFKIEICGWDGTEMIDIEDEVIEWTYILD